MDEVPETIERCTVLSPGVFSDFPVTAPIKKPGPGGQEDLPRSHSSCGRTGTRASLS